MVKTKNKFDRKAWIRIIEVFIAILIILGSLLYIMSKQQPTESSTSIYEKQRDILNIISKNDSLRENIIKNDNSEVNNFINKMIPSTWSFATNICDLGKICPNPVDIHEKEVYATEVIISSTLKEYSPRKLRFFVWMK